jgi:hypothetical protein
MMCAVSHLERGLAQRSGHGERRRHQRDCSALGRHSQRRGERRPPLRLRALRHNAAHDAATCFVNAAQRRARASARTFGAGGSMEKRRLGRRVRRSGRFSSPSSTSPLCAPPHSTSSHGTAIDARSSARTATAGAAAGDAGAVSWVEVPPRHHPTPARTRPQSDVPPAPGDGDVVGIAKSLAGSGACGAGGAVGAVGAGREQRLRSSATCDALGEAPDGSMTSLWVAAQDEMSHTIGSLDLG